MKEFMMMFNEYNWQVTGFYPYTSCVIDRILKQSYNYTTEEHDFLTRIWNKFWVNAEVRGCKMDNKIVLQITKVGFPDGCNSVLYLGRYDGMVSLGLAYYQDSWLKESNKHFKLMPSK